ncbi:MAG: biosynthetic arginine decarboxylase [Gemmatimonadetes bacterium]|nr:biosynthetic arginine decarboxylase [Gemmatimonadota bacterium]
MSSETASPSVSGAPAAAPAGTGATATATPPNGATPVATGGNHGTHAPHAAPARPWTIDSARALYSIEGWGAGFFDVNEAGNMIVRPDRATPERTLDLYEFARDLEEQGVGLPVLLRFADILGSRVRQLHEAFATAITDFEYTGSYTTVFPIKVNQQRHVVEEVLAFGAESGVGLECGSKPELQAVLGVGERTDHIIICNGYKDEEFMRLALMGQQLGHKVFIVLEQVSEVDVLLAAARDLGVRPMAGVRIKLASEGSGRWAQSGGEKSKFGLSPAQLVRLLDKLKAEDALDVVKLIHFHIGSQVTDIRYIKAGLEEITRFYAELRTMGLDITHVDVGGGLGVDYDGSGSTAQASMNYSLEEYARDIIYTMGEACREQALPMPAIISESGRALTAHHALLLLSVIDVESQSEPEVPVLAKADHALLHEMLNDYQTIATKRLRSPRRVREIYHDITYGKERTQNLFNSGVLPLRGRACAEQLYLATINELSRFCQRDREEYADILADIEVALTDRYFCNFSLFQSLPDSWAIDQLFPIVPIHRLNEEPVRRGTLQDITCDSDGKIDRFVDGRTSLPLHPFRDGEPYVLGIFLTGAYQEILGDLHNLFGDTNAVHVKMTGQGYEITDLVHGDTVTEVLNYVQFRANDLLGTFRRKVGAATHLGRQEANTFIAEYVAGLEGYTYLEGEAAR